MKSPDTGSGVRRQIVRKHQTWCFMTWRVDLKVSEARRRQTAGAIAKMSSLVLAFGATPVSLAELNGMSFGA